MWVEVDIHILELTRKARGNGVPFCCNPALSLDLPRGERQVALLPAVAYLNGLQCHAQHLLLKWLPSKHASLSPISRTMKARMYSSLQRSTRAPMCPTLVCGMPEENTCSCRHKHTSIGASLRGFADV